MENLVFENADDSGFQAFKWTVLECVSDVCETNGLIWVCSKTSRNVIVTEEACLRAARVGGDYGKDLEIHHEWLYGVWNITETAGVER